MLKPRVIAAENSACHHGKKLHLFFRAVKFDLLILPFVFLSLTRKKYLTQIMQHIFFSEILWLALQLTI